MVLGLFVRRCTGIGVLIVRKRTIGSGNGTSLGRVGHGCVWEHLGKGGMEWQQRGYDMQAFYLPSSRLDCAGGGAEVKYEREDDKLNASQYEPSEKSPSLHTITYLGSVRTVWTFGINSMTSVLVINGQASRLVSDPTTRFPHQPSSLPMAKKRTWVSFSNDEGAPTKRDRQVKPPPASSGARSSKRAKSNGIAPSLTHP